MPHDADWTYSLTFPATHEWHGLRAEESYRRVHEWVRAAFAGLGVTVELATCGRRTGPGQCFAGWEESDVLWQGRKIAGAAQRRTCNGLLVQGSIQPPPMALARDDWQEAMCATAPAPFGVDWIELQPEAALMEAAGKLAGEKYARSAYNRKR